MNKTVATLTIPADDDLHLQTEDGQVVVSSRVVAERFGKQHKHVLESIENIKGEISTAKFSTLFIPSTYKASNGKMNPEMLMKRDGFTLLAMGFTGKEALHWKLKYIEAFNKMEQTIKNQNSHFQGLSAELQAIMMHDKKIQHIEHKVTQLEDSIHITRAQQKQLKQFAATVVVKQLGSKHSPAYKELKSKAFSEFWKSYQNALNVASYLDTPKKDFQLALNFVNNWTPGRDLQLMIKGANIIGEE